MLEETNETNNESTNDQAQAPANRSLLEMGEQSNDNSTANDGDENTFSNKTVAERPEGLPEDLWDYDNATFQGDKLYDAYQAEAKKALGLRQKLSEGLPKPPEKPDDYVIEIPQEVSEYIKEDDATLAVVRQAAHSTGLSGEQLQTFVGLYLKGLAEGNLVNAEQGMSEEDIAQRDAEYITQEKAKLGANADQVIDSLRTWGVGLQNNGVLSEEDRQTLLHMGNSAAEVRVLSKLRALTGEPTMPVRASDATGMPSPEELQSLVNKPEYKTDPSFRADVEKKFVMVYGR